MYIKYICIQYMCKCIIYIYIHVYWLVVPNIFYFPFHIWDVILPIDELICFRGVDQPPTSYIIWEWVKTWYEITIWLGESTSINQLYIYIVHAFNIDPSHRKLAGPRQPGCLSPQRCRLSNYCWLLSSWLMTHLRANIEIRTLFGASIDIIYI